jgi:hypothetical protein
VLFQADNRVLGIALCTKIRHVTAKKYESPEWAAPCIRFMDYMFQVLGLIDLTRRGAGVLTTIPHALDVLMTTGKPSEEEMMSYEERKKSAKKTAELARSEIGNDFPLLHSHSLMGAWGALEGMVEDLAVSWLRHNPSALDHPKLSKVRVPFIEFQQMTDHERLRFLVAELQRDLGLELKTGATKFEALLAALGLGGTVDRRVRDAIFEAQNLRNLFAHRGGVADRRFVTNCPNLQYTVGDTVKIGDQDFTRNFFGLFAYGATILNRCRAIEGMPQPVFDFPGFEGVLSARRDGRTSARSSRHLTVTRSGSPGAAPADGVQQQSTATTPFRGEPW